MSIITCIDLGSNSFRVLKYDCLNNKVISEHNQVTGMADGLNKTKQISSEAQNRVINAILESSKKLDFKASEAICVTTAAMRFAKNSNQVLKNFEKNTGARFEIIDSNEEARLTLLAVKHALKREKIKSNKFILLDIGGGSVEIIVNENNNSYSKSFDFGIITLAQMYLEHEQLINKLEEYKKEIKKFLENLKINTKEYSFVATAGTPTTIAAMKLNQNFFNYDKNKINGTIVNLEDIYNSLKIFKNSTKEEILTLVGPGKVEYIEVGIYIYKAIFEAINKNESIVFDDGLREGVAINHCLKKQ